jgi:protein-serine/threonine kinase
MCKEGLGTRLSTELNGSQHNGETVALNESMLSEESGNRPIHHRSSLSMKQYKVGPADFTPLRLLGKGSFGEVFMVREDKTGDLYAMKVLPKSRILGQNLLRYAKTERDVLSYTKHPFIVSLNAAF